MEHLLFLTQRIPFPPDKGDKIRAWHIFRHLAESYHMHLGCFYDDPQDERHIPYLQSQCASLCCRPLDPTWARLRSIARVRPGLPLTLGYFGDAALRRWVADTIETYHPTRIFVFCSAMAPYALPYPVRSRILDMVDVDSDKWRQYAATKSWPLSAIYAREHRTLLAFERAIAVEFDATLLVSEAEADCLRALAPETSQRVVAMPNGIDASFFDPDRAYDNPYPRPGPCVVFTGAMDYWPNVDAVSWFAAEILPKLRARWPGLEFWIVGLNPSGPVRDLARTNGIVVTGRVEDVRPYLRHAACVVAPLRIARGVQNKVLEAMAMARPVVLTPQAREGLALKDGEDVLVASGANAFADRMHEVLSGSQARLGPRARERVRADYQWNFAILDEIIGGRAPALAAAG